MCEKIYQHRAFGVGHQSVPTMQSVPDEVLEHICFKYLSPTIVYGRVSLLNKVYTGRITCRAYLTPFLFVQTLRSIVLRQPVVIQLRLFDPMFESPLMWVVRDYWKPIVSVVGDGTFKKQQSGVYGTTTGQLHQNYDLYETAFGIPNPWMVNILFEWTLDRGPKPIPITPAAMAQFDRAPAEFIPTVPLTMAGVNMPTQPVLDVFPGVTWLLWKTDKMRLPLVNLARSFPNLRKLRMHVDDDIDLYPHVWNAIKDHPHLNRLRVDSSANLLWNDVDWPCADADALRKLPDSIIVESITFKMWPAQVEKLKLIIFSGAESVMGDVWKALLEMKGLRKISYHESADKWFNKKEFGRISRIQVTHDSVSYVS